MLGESENSMARARKQLTETAADEPRRRSRAAVIAMDAAELGRAGFSHAGFADPTLVLRWREIAGPDVARIAQPLRIRQGPSGLVLTLRADPAAAVFLQHESRALCARISACLGTAAIERLRFVPGEVAAESRLRPRKHPQDKHPQDSAADDPARKFAGPDGLKSALLALARVRSAT
jgi:hypothetical protein